MRNGTLKIPLPRNILINIHKDLFGIDDRVIKKYDARPLNQFEKLVLVLEDRRFFGHWGFDFKSIIRDCCAFALKRKHGGSSTVDMQFVRTVTGYRQRTLKRKIYEIILAHLIQYRYTKIQILRSYLACAYFGSKLYGCEDASWHVFEKYTDELDPYEAAQLASMLVAPRPLKPTDQWQNRIARRSEYGLKLLARFEKSLEKDKC
jgi:membrane peptidoglycan carboxypeptidase